MKQVLVLYASTHGHLDDYGYTDWDDVAPFGRRVAELLPAAAPVS